MQNEKNNREIIQLAAKLQMSLGEALFRAKNLNTMLCKDPDLGMQFGTNLENLINALGQLNQLYRHNFADEIESRITKRA